MPADVSLSYLEGFCDGAGLRLEEYGTIGFGRPCVGILAPDRNVYVAWEDGCGPIGAPDAYHKDSYLAVLGTGPAAIVQLAEWVRHIARQPFELYRREKDAPDLGTLLEGWTDELAIRRPT
jgi:hypothetical protein